MLFDELNEYKHTDHFFYNKDRDLGEVCNAPKDASGVYLILELKNGRITLVYIGCSGTLTSDGELRHGKGGLFDSIVNGKQFGDARKVSWRNKLIEEGIEALDIYWYETFNDDIQHIPSFVEGLLLQMHFDVYGRLPAWNMEY